MNNKTTYRFIFRYDGELGQVVRECRPGQADTLARDLARRIGKEYRAEDVTCVWKGPAGSSLPWRMTTELLA